MNKLISNHQQQHQSNPDKSYKPRASRAHKNRGGLSPQDLDYEIDLNELDEDEKLNSNKEEVDLLTKKRLRPRKEKINYIVFRLIEDKF